MKTSNRVHLKGGKKAACSQAEIPSQPVQAQTAVPEGHSPQQFRLQLLCPDGKEFSHLDITPAQFQAISDAAALEEKTFPELVLNGLQFELSKIAPPKKNTYGELFYDTPHDYFDQRMPGIFGAMEIHKCDGLAFVARVINENAPLLRRALQEHGYTVEEAIRLREIELLAAVASAVKWSDPKTKVRMPFGGAKSVFPIDPDDYFGEIACCLYNLRIPIMRICL